MSVSRIALILSFIFINSLVKAQDTRNYFEGVISYNIKATSNSGNLTPDQLENLYGKSVALFYKEGNYLEKYVKGFILEHIYNKKDNKFYIKRNLTDTLYWTFCGVPGKLLKSEINRGKVKILGIECDELINYMDGNKISYYFNTDTLNINPSWHKDCTLYNENINYEKMKSLFLGFKLEFPDLIIQLTATSIDWKKIEDNLFVIPKTRILVEDK